MNWYLGDWLRLECHYNPMQGLNTKEAMSFHTVSCGASVSFIQLYSLRDAHKYSLLSDVRNLTKIVINSFHYLTCIYDMRLREISGLTPILPGPEYLWDFEQLRFAQRINLDF